MVKVKKTQRKTDWSCLEHTWGLCKFFLSFSLFLNVWLPLPLHFFTGTIWIFYIWDKQKYNRKGQRSQHKKFSCNLLNDPEQIKSIIDCKRYMNTGADFIFLICILNQQSPFWLHEPAEMAMGEGMVSRVHTPLHKWSVSPSACEASFPMSLGNHKLNSGGK